MPLTEKEVLLAAFDDAWSHKWESFELATKDLTEEEATYQHPSYRDDKHEQGWPKPGTILWQLVHMEYWHRYYLSVLESLPEHEPVMPVVEPVATLHEAQERLLHTRKQVRNTLAEMQDSSLDVALRGRLRTGEFLRMIIRHDSWHASQIAVARRLYRSRPS